jgi:ZIP family zinc transporter
VSSSQIALLGAIAGLTIVLGLPIGRMNAVTPKVKAFLNGTAIGILVFLLWDVLTNAWQPADKALTAHHYGSAVGNAAVMLGCAGAGLLGLRPVDCPAGPPDGSRGAGRGAGPVGARPGRSAVGRRPGRPAVHADRRRHRHAQLR